MFGLTLDDLDDQSVEVLPDNLDATNAFIAMGTQWRVGMGGVTGLDYAALPVVLRMLGVTRADWNHVFEGLRVLEAETLSLISEARK